MIEGRRRRGLKKSGLCLWQVFLPLFPERMSNTEPSWHPPVIISPRRPPSGTPPIKRNSPVRAYIPIPGKIVTCGGRFRSRKAGFRGWKLFFPCRKLSFLGIILGFPCWKLNFPCGKLFFQGWKLFFPCGKLLFPGGKECFPCGKRRKLGVFLRPNGRKLIFPRWKLLFRHRKLRGKVSKPAKNGINCGFLMI